MFSIRKINPMVRAVGTIGAVAAIATGATFAALQSQATLTDNTISSANAALLIDNTDITPASGLTATDLGYDFVGIVPGGAGSQVGNFDLKNSGAANLAVQVSVPTAVTFTVIPVSAVDKTKVHVMIQRGAGTPQDILLSNLEAGPVTIDGGPLAPNATESFHVQVKMDADAFTGSSASSGTFNFNFDATGV